MTPADHDQDGDWVLIEQGLTSTEAEMLASCLRAAGIDAKRAARAAGRGFDGAAVAAALTNFVLTHGDYLALQATVRAPPPRLRGNRRWR